MHDYNVMLLHVTVRYTHVSSTDVYIFFYKFRSYNVLR